ncbi:MAG: P-loop NTPase fold protein [Calditrichia bacterium]
MNEKIDQYKNEKDLLIQFRDKLQTFAEMITHYSDGENYRPMVFIIDELDRCRPTYAVELIERIKHLFLVNGIVFVLGIDREQLGNSVRSLFGNDMKVDGYLRRFIDLSYQLPNTQPKAFIKHLFEHFGLDKYLWEKSRKNSIYTDYDQLTAMYYADYSRIFNLKARVIEQCVGQFNVIARTARDGVDLFPEFLIFLICLRASESNTQLNQLLNREISPKTLMNHIYQLYGGELIFKKLNYAPFLEACVLTADMNLSEIENLIKTMEEGKELGVKKAGENDYTDAVLNCIRRNIGSLRNTKLNSVVTPLLEMSSAFSA